MNISTSFQNQLTYFRYSFILAHNQKRQIKTERTKILWTFFVSSFLFGLNAKIRQLQNGMQSIWCVALSVFAAVIPM